jgi:hypothetical protein
LGIEDFVLREDGTPQQISLVKEDQPLSVVILVDGMACIVPPEHELQRSDEALRLLGDDAEIALMAWDSDVALVQHLTRDRDAIANQLKDRVSFFYALNGHRNTAQGPVRPGRDFQRPGEAIYQAARYLEQNASSGRRKVIIVIAYPGWLGERHLHTAAEVKELLERIGVERGCGERFFAHDICSCIGAEVCSANLIGK